MYFTYLLRCADGTLYGGWTTDLRRRLAAHNAGKGAKYTRARLPAALVYWEEWDSKQAAMAREWALKHLSRGEKLALLRKREAQPLAVRAMAPGDVPLLARLYPEEEGASRRMLAALGRPDALCLTLEHRGEPAGLALGRLADRAGPGPAEALALPSLRGRGAEALLLAEARRRAAALGGEWDGCLGADF